MSTKFCGFRTSKKALSPLTATMVLLAFSLIIGALTISWGERYVEEIGGEEEVRTGTIMINYKDIDTDLKELQLKHIIGELTQEEYLEEEKKLK